MTDKTTTELLGEVVAKTRYARFIDSKGRREHWDETVDRFMAHFKEEWDLRAKTPLSVQQHDEIRSAILNKEVMPSMRWLMTAGDAAKRDNICTYNCAYLAINNKRAFSEALYILMNGTGVGFSCERQEIGKLPPIPNELKQSDDVIVVQDSKLGWAKAFRKLLSALWEGDIPHIDYSLVRPAGSRLVTFGGRASGPAPLKDLFNFCIATFKNAEGTHLNSLEVHDIMCKIGEIVVVGGVRRAALISLSNFSDKRLRDAKSGNWWETNRHRSLSNNSVAYTERPDALGFVDEWGALIRSGSGERGIFNRRAAQRQASRYGRRGGNYNYGTNPCSEIVLRDRQFCNLTEVVIRDGDSIDYIKHKVLLATTIGTLQSALTSFSFLSREWRDNCDDERLLGVSLTGIYDNELTNGKQGYEVLKNALEDWRLAAVDTNLATATILGVRGSAAITCVKPSGTVSQLVGSASGIHPRHSGHYIRTVRMDVKDPVCEFLADQGVPWEPCVNYPDSVKVFSFPIESPRGSVTRNDVTAIEHLELWKIYQDHYCEHKPSVTISVDKDEWMRVGSWVWDHFDEMSGVAFLPKTEHVYQQAPYIDITEKEYNERAARFPKHLEWDRFVESSDRTEGAQQLACVGDKCELV